MKSRLQPRADQIGVLDIGATHESSEREWIGDSDPGTDGTGPIDIMWRFFQWSAVTKLLLELLGLTKTYLKVPM